MKSPHHPVILSSCRPRILASPRRLAPHPPAFTLFETLIALAIFAIAFVGLLVALDASVQAGIEARHSATLRRALEDRLAFCLVRLPEPDMPRAIEAADNNGIAIVETLEPYIAANVDGIELTGLWLLTITATTADGTTATADTLIYRR